MIVKNSIEDLVSYDFCQFLSSDSDTALIFSTQEKIRNAYLSCANMNQDSDLLAVYLDQYQDDPNKGVVEEKYAEMLIDNAKKENTGTLSLPPVSGKTASGKSEIRVTNATDQSIRIVLKGPDTVIKEMEKCTWCTDYNNIGPATCPSTDSETTISLKPGHYDVYVATTKGESVTPYTGTWDLQDGDVYSDCYFIVTTIR